LPEPLSIELARLRLCHLTGGPSGDQVPQQAVSARPLSLNLGNL